MYRILKISRIALGLAMFIATSPAAAKTENQSPEFFSTFENLNEINSNKFKSNNAGERARDVLKSRVIDSSNKVIGDLENIVLHPSGAIARLEVDFNRLHPAPVSLDYSALGMEAVGNGYKSRYSDDQLKDMIPTLLADIEPAAGSDAQAYSLKTMMGTPIKTESGKTLGKVVDVVFSDLGKRAEFLNVELGGAGLKRGNIMIPFSAAEFSTVGSARSASVTEVMGDAMIEYTSGGLRRHKPLK